MGICKSLDDLRYISNGSNKTLQLRIAYGIGIILLLLFMSFSILKHTRTRTQLILENQNILKGVGDDKGAINTENITDKEEVQRNIQFGANPADVVCNISKLTPINTQRDTEQPSFLGYIIYIYIYIYIYSKENEEANDISVIPTSFANQSIFLGDMFTENPFALGQEIEESHRESQAPFNTDGKTSASDKYEIKAPMRIAESDRTVNQKELKDCITNLPNLDSVNVTPFPRPLDWPTNKITYEDGASEVIPDPPDPHAVVHSLIIPEIKETAPQIGLAYAVEFLLNMSQWMFILLAYIILYYWLEVDLECISVIFAFLILFGELPTLDIQKLPLLSLHKTPFHIVSTIVISILILCIPLFINIALALHPFLLIISFIKDIMRRKGCKARAIFMRSGMQDRDEDCRYNMERSFMQR